MVAAIELYLDVDTTRRVRRLWQALEDEGVPILASLLEQRHDRLAGAGIEVWEHYRPGRWVPHCTVSMRVPNPMVAAGVRRCLEFLPIHATVTGAAVTDHANDISRPLDP